MRVVVTGGRDYEDKEMVENILTKLELLTMDRHGEEWGQMHVATGECSTGADSFAKEWAKSNEVNGVEYTGYQAKWGQEGGAAGPIRNTRMLDDFKPTIVVAFPGGSGTVDCVAKARARNITVLSVGKEFPF